MGGNEMNIHASLGMNCNIVKGDSQTASLIIIARTLGLATKISATPNICVNWLKVSELSPDVDCCISGGSASITQVV